MKKPANVQGTIPTMRWIIRQAWSDLKSVYYANTPVWRWLKSGALVFLGLCIWAGASVVLSVRPEWSVLYLFIAYGFLLVLWGPLTHFAIVPTIIKLRRTATHPVVRTIVRHGGKINLTVFFMLVIVLAIVQPGVMLLEFGGAGDTGAEVRGQVECTEEESQITCEIHNPGGFDHAVVLAGGDVLDRDDEEPYRLEFAREDLPNSRYLVQLRDPDGNVLRTTSHSA